MCSSSSLSLLSGLKSKNAFVAATIVIMEAPNIPHELNCSPRIAYAKKAPSRNYGEIEIISCFKVVL